MALFDALAMFSGAISAAGAISGQTVTGTSTGVLGTNSYDTTGGSPSGQNIDLGKGGDLDIVFRILTAFVGATSVEFQFVQADDAALGTNLEVIASSGAVAEALLTAGSQVVVDVTPSQPRVTRRYVGVRYVIVGTQSAGAATATLQPDHGDFPIPAFNSGFAVL